MCITLQYPCQENPIDRRALWETRWSDWTNTHTHTHTRTFRENWSLKCFVWFSINTLQSDDISLLDMYLIIITELVKFLNCQTNIFHVFSSDYASLYREDIKEGLPVNLYNFQSYLKVSVSSQIITLSWWIGFGNSMKL